MGTSRNGTQRQQDTARDETVAEGRKSETQVRSGRDGNCSRMLDARRAAKKTSFPSQLRSKVEPPRSPVEDLAVSGNRCARVGSCAWQPRSPAEDLAVTCAL